MLHELMRLFGGGPSDPRRPVGWLKVCPAGTHVMERWESSCDACREGVRPSEPIPAPRPVVNEAIPPTRIEHRVERRPEPEPAPVVRPPPTAP